MATRPSSQTVTAHWVFFLPSTKQSHLLKVPLPSRERTPQPQAPGPKESPPAALGYCTARGLFSTHDNNGSSSQKPQKLLLPISVTARSLGHFYRGRNQAVQTYHFHWFSATAYFLRVFVLCFPAALVACKPVIPIIFVTLSGAL